MSKTKNFTKQTIFIIVIVLIIIAVFYWYITYTTENFDNGNNKKNLNSSLNDALKLVSNIELPDNILNNIQSVPSISTITPKLAFSNIKESFYGMGDNTINSFGKAKSITSSKNWDSANLTYSSNKKNKKNKALNQILNRPPQPIPLPEGEMDMFATTQFKPQCCPNTYTNSTGCACMTTQQYKYLIDRGGNNVPYSEY
jgi:hypothetical protein